MQYLQFFLDAFTVFVVKSKAHTFSSTKRHSRTTTTKKSKNQSVCVCSGFNHFPFILPHELIVQSMKRWAEPNSMIAESKLTNTIDRRERTDS